MKREFEIGKVFDEMSSEYTGIMDDMVPHYRLAMAAMITHIPESVQVSNILDLGCGNGNVTALLKARYPKAEIHLLDASQEMLDACESRFGTSNLTFEHDTFQAFEIEDNAYDLIVAGFSVHHLDGQEKAALFAKLNKGLRKTGVFSMTDLMLEKTDPTHPKFLEEWQGFVYANGRTTEDWRFVKDHYDKYDKPSSFVNMQTWLAESGFGRTDLTWHEGPWGCLHAYKS